MSLQSVSSLDKQIGNLDTQLNTAQGELGKFNDKGSYLGLLDKVMQSAYGSNKDLIEYRKSLREKLYSGNPLFTPTNFNQLDPNQQATVQNAGRGSLVAGIQAANETQAARGSGINDVLTTEGSRYSEQRQAIADQITGLQRQRDNLDNQRQNLLTANRNFGLDALTKYPGLKNMLSQKELTSINKGDLDETIIAKIGQAASDWERYQASPKGSGQSWGDMKIEDRLAAVGTKGYGVQVQTQDSVLGDKVAEWQRDHGQSPSNAVVNQLKNEVTAGFKSGKYGGVDFITPNGKVSGQEWTNTLNSAGVNINWKDAAKAVGVDVDKVTDKGPLVRTWLSTPKAQGGGQGLTTQEQVNEILGEGLKPEDFGFRKNSAGKWI